MERMGGEGRGGDRMERKGEVLAYDSIKGSNNP